MGNTYCSLLASWCDRAKLSPGNGGRGLFMCLYTIYLWIIYIYAFWILIAVRLFGRIILLKTGRTVTRDLGAFNGFAHGGRCPAFGGIAGGSNRCSSGLVVESFRWEKGRVFDLDCCRSISPARCHYRGSISCRACPTVASFHCQGWCTFIIRQCCCIIIWWKPLGSFQPRWPARKTGES